MYRFQFFPIVILLVYSCTKEADNYPEKVIDIDGNVYGTVLIGDQLWMKENLRTTSFSNGDPIPTTFPKIMNIVLESEPLYQWSYYADSDYPNLYGNFYTWFATVDSRNICPKGWSVPTSNDWKELIEYLGGEAVAGDKLKELNLGLWDDPSITTLNPIGFDAAPTGSRLPEGFITDLTRTSYWASDNIQIEIDGNPTSAFALSYLLENTSSQIVEMATIKISGEVVRCIYDK